MPQVHIDIEKYTKKEDLFKCDTCGNTFKTKRHLTQHMIRHYTKRRYICTRCVRPFQCRSTSVVLKIAMLVTSGFDSSTNNFAGHLVDIITKHTLTLLHNTTLLTNCFSVAIKCSITTNI